MKYLITILAICSLAGGCQRTADLSDSELRIVARIRQIRDLRAEVAANCWPGFDAPENDATLLYYTDSVCYAANPTPSFRNEFRARLVYRDKGMKIYKTALPDTLPFHMETYLDFDDTTTSDSRYPLVRCSSPEITATVITDITTDSLWLPMVLHEYAHGFQFRQPGFAATFAREMISLPEAQLARIHKDHDWLDRAVRSENTTLRAALAARGSSRNSLIRSFGAQRAARKESMSAELGDSTVRAEEIYEVMEGMARYIEAWTAFRLGSYSANDDWLYDTDQSDYFYATGYNIMRLLDSCGIDKSRLVTKRLAPLETTLLAENH